MIQGVQATVDIDVEIENMELNPVVVIPIVTACCGLLCLGLGLFAHYRPRNSLVKWFDRNVTEILVLWAGGILSSFIVFVSTKPPEIALTEPLTIFGCCLIAWTFLAALGFHRNRHNKTKNGGNGDETSSAKAFTNVNEADGIVIEIEVDATRN